MSDGKLYRNRGGKHIAEDGTVVRNGDTFHPTERELEAFGDKFEKVDEAGGEGDEREDGEVGESDADGDTYTADELGEKEHNELRSIASECDDVDGRAGIDELVEALAGRERVDIEG
jgi:hypothetical protein